MATRAARARRRDMRESDVPVVKDETQPVPAREAFFAMRNISLPPHNMGKIEMQLLTL
jgi:hypothetical protein